jgi:RimJ/RimL family protein N-acetyltransferase
MIDPDAGWRSARLAIEPLQAGSAAELFAVLDDPSLHEFTGGAPLTLDELAARYGRLATRRSPDGMQLWANWLVREVATGQAIGTLQATVPVEGPVHLRAEVAWLVGRPWQGNGYAGEAAAGLVGRLLDDGWVVMAHIHPDHVASQAVARHVGLVPTDEVVDGEVTYVSR